MIITILRPGVAGSGANKVQFNVLMTMVDNVNMLLMNSLMQAHEQHSGIDPPW